MTEENGTSAYRLTREVAELKGRVDMVIKDQEEESEVMREIFGRLSVLEKRMAQVVLIGTLLSIALPTVLTIGIMRLESDQIQIHK